MAEQAAKLMTPEEFFAWEPDDEERYELADGLAVKMMTGASEVHDRVVTNLILALGSQLRGSRCRPATADVALRTRIRSLRRPDVTVTCDDPRADSYESRNPRMVVEVLSPSNKGLAWHRKLEEYRRVAGLAYILLVESTAAKATLLIRNGAAWDASDFDALSDIIELPEIGCRLAMADIYDRLTFEPNSGANI